MIKLKAYAMVCALGSNQGLILHALCSSSSFPYPAAAGDPAYHVLNYIRTLLEQDKQDRLQRQDRKKERYLLCEELAVATKPLNP